MTGNRASPSPSGRQPTSSLSGTSGRDGDACCSERRVTLQAGRGAKRGNPGVCSWGRFGIGLFLLGGEEGRFQIAPTRRSAQGRSACRRTPVTAGTFASMLTGSGVTV